VCGCALPPRHCIWIYVHYSASVESTVRVCQTEECVEAWTRVCVYVCVTREQSPSHSEAPLERRIIDRYRPPRLVPPKLPSHRIKRADCTHTHAHTHTYPSARQCAPLSLLRTHGCIHTWYMALQSRLNTALSQQHLHPENRTPLDIDLLFLPSGWATERHHRSKRRCERGFQHNRPSHIQTSSRAAPSLKSADGERLLAWRWKPGDRKWVTYLCVCVCVCVLWAGQ